MSPISSSHSKTDVRYWLDKVYHRRFRQGGVEVVKPNYYVQIQHQGERLRFHLQTPNKAAAAARARGIYKDLLEGGWEAIRAKIDEATVSVTDGSPTVGDLLGVIESISTARPATLETYFSHSGDKSPLIGSPLDSSGGLSSLEFSYL